MFVLRKNELGPGDEVTILLPNEGWSGLRCRSASERLVRMVDGRLFHIHLWLENELRMIERLRNFDEPHALVSSLPSELKSHTSTEMTVRIVS